MNSVCELWDAAVLEKLIFQLGSIVLWKYEMNLDSSIFITAV